MPSSIVPSIPHNASFSAQSTVQPSPGAARTLEQPRLRSAPLPDKASSQAYPVPSRTPISVDPDDSPTGDATGADGYFGDSSAFAFVSKVLPESQNVQGVHLEHGQASTSPSVSVQASHERSAPEYPCIAGAQRLPDRHLADSLVDGYFNRFHPLYPFLHEGSFRSEYENMWPNPEEVSCRSSWYALLNTVFALGCEYCDEIVASQVTATVTPFLDRARTIILSLVHKRGNLELIQALLLLCHHLQGTLNLNECWNLVGIMIRSAVSIGLHLNPTSLSISSVEKEVRKRVWWGCFALDRTVSMKFGRPSSLHLQDALDVPYPLPIDDQYINNESHTPRQPSNCPSTTTFFIHTIKLTQLIDDILRNLYSPRRRVLRRDDTTPLVPEQELAELIVLEGRLRSWWNAKPAHLSPASTTWTNPVFQRQQTVMQIRYKQTMILLHRPLLIKFSRDNTDNEFVRAIAIAGSQICVAAARQTISIIQELYHRQFLNPIWYNLHYIFTSMGVLLHVRNMDRRKLEIMELELQQQEILDALDCGRAFLKTASQSNPLAIRYIKILQYVQGMVEQDQSKSVDRGDGREQNATSPQLNQANVAYALESWSDLATWQTQRFFTDDELDLDGLDLDSFLSSA